MDTLEELIYYCREPRPAGALLLTGEWGCGKTYMIKNILSKEINSEAILLYVSLFGIDSIDELNRLVKKAWVRICMESNIPIKTLNKHVEKTTKVFKNIVNVGYEFIPKKFKNIVNGVLSFDGMDFIKISPTLGDKKIILIFDDLERSIISTSILLGCINDYCENQFFNTIIIANEEKLKENEAKGKYYNEIKEKIVKRSISYVPDYTKIVNDILSDIPFDDYGKFIKNNEFYLIELFSPKITTDEEIKNFLLARQYEITEMSIQDKINVVLGICKQKPHNIRTLKYALQDFKRVYLLLDEKGILNIVDYFFSFVCYVMCFKGRIIGEDLNDDFLSDEDKISLIYSELFKGRYLTEGIKCWIKTGVWDKKCIELEAESILEEDKSDNPYEKARTHEIYNLEEKDLNEGYTKLLENAYIGKLNLNDYTTLIINSCYARNHGIIIPDINWNKLKEGISKQMEMLIQNGERNLSFRKIDVTNENLYSNEEIESYKMIEEFIGKLIFEQNKLSFIRLMLFDTVNGINEVSHMEFDKFDEEMANAAAQGFNIISNSEKNSFIDCFELTWGSDDLSVIGRENPYLEGLNLLKTKVSELSKDYEKEGKTIAKVHADKFVSVIDRIIEKQTNNCV